MNKHTPQPSPAPGGLDGARARRPIDPTAGPRLTELVLALRRRRDHLGYSLDRLSHHTGISTSTLHLAESGQAMPTRATLTRGYEPGCDREQVAELRRLWSAAKAEQQQLPTDAAPEDIRDLPGFGRQLAALLLATLGTTSRRRIAERTGIPNTTVQRALACVDGPPTATVLRALLAAAKALPDLDRWLTARGRLLGEPATSVVSEDNVIVDSRISRGHHPGSRGLPAAGGDPAPRPITVVIPTPDRHTLEVNTTLLTDRIRDHLAKLCQGTGVHAVDLRLDAVLLAVCDIPPGLDTHTTRTALCKALLNTAEEFPENVILPALVALNLGNATAGGRSYRRQRFDTLTGRLDALADHIEREARTARRRANDSLLRLAQALTAAYLTRTTHQDGGDAHAQCAAHR